MTTTTTPEPGTSNAFSPSSTTGSRDGRISTLVVEIHNALQGKQLELAQQALKRYDDGDDDDDDDKSPAHHASAIMKWLSVRLFRPPNDSSSSSSSMDAVIETQEDAYLHVLLFLVQSNPTQYLTTASSAIVQTAVHLSLDGTKPMHVSNLLRQVLVQQMTTSDSAQVRTDATNTLIACTRKVGPTTILIPAISELVEGCWKVQLENSKSKSNNKAQASTIAVRCASTMIELWMALGDVALTASTTATKLLVQMVQDESDPLVQLSILDLLEHMATKLSTKEEAESFSSSSTFLQTRQWLLSPTIVTPLCQMCGVSASTLQVNNNAMDIDSESKQEEVGMIDPLLGGAALNLLSALCAIFHSMLVAADNNEHVSDTTTSTSRQEDQAQQHQWLVGAFYRALLQFANQHEESSSVSDEAERLALVHAISNFASSSSQALQMVLDNPQIRDVWLSIHQVSKPKLQAAILVSVAMVLDPNLVAWNNITSNAGGGSGDEQQQPTTNPVRTNTRINPTTARNLYNMLGYVNTSSSSSASTTNWLLTTGKKAQSPFPEVRRATYAVLTAIATIGPTGVMLLAQADGGWTTLETFLLNRDVEKDQNGRQARFEIVAAVYKNAPPGLLSDSLLDKLKRHLQQGPHYVKSLTYDVMAAE